LDVCKDPTDANIETLKKRLGIGITRDEARNKGDVIRKFVSSFKAPIEKLLKNLPKERNKSDRAIVEASRSGGNKWATEVHKFTTMKDYSPWLAQFQGADNADRIEMPGQYVVPPFVL
jgi:hypothetical protein